MKCVTRIPSWGTGTRPSLALHHRAHLDGAAEPGGGDPCRQRDRRVEGWCVVDVVAIELGSRLDGGALGNLRLSALHADGRRRASGLELVAVEYARRLADRLEFGAHVLL